MTLRHRPNAKTHANGLTPAQAERVAILAEEAGEIVQACGKILRHGLDCSNPLIPIGATPNRRQLHTEINQLVAVAEAMAREGDISALLPPQARLSLWSAKYEWTHHQVPVSHELRRSTKA